MNPQVKAINFTTTAIEIIYGQNQVFYSHKNGSDLADLDELLSFMVPEISFTEIDLITALNLERKLYRQLADAEVQRAALIEIKIFAAYIQRKFAIKKGKPKVTAKSKLTSQRARSARRLAYA